VTERREQEPAVNFQAGAWAGIVLCATRAIGVSGQRWLAKLQRQADLPHVHRAEAADVAEIVFAGPKPRAGSSARNIALDNRISRQPAAPGHWQVLQFRCRVYWRKSGAENGATSRE
jgi:hypothetical protein